MTAVAGRTICESMEGQRRRTETAFSADLWGIVGVSLAYIMTGVTLRIGIGPQLGRYHCTWYIGLLQVGIDVCNATSVIADQTKRSRLTTSTDKYRQVVGAGNGELQCRCPAGGSGRIYASDEQLPRMRR
ncbi:hypothetical protein BD413DRAFT_89389 [Trametes elegans]|nr:hypothetical protein BD413DRAFT_89389 [Trametes elegans]